MIARLNKKGQDVDVNRIIRSRKQRRNVKKETVFTRENLHQTNQISRYVGKASTRPHLYGQVIRTKPIVWMNFKVNRDLSHATWKHRVWWLLLLSISTSLPWLVFWWSLLSSIHYLCHLHHHHKHNRGTFQIVIVYCQNSKANYPWLRASTFKLFLSIGRWYVWWRNPFYRSRVLNDWITTNYRLVNGQDNQLQ